MKSHSCAPILLLTAICLMAALSPADTLYVASNGLNKIYTFDPDKTQTLVTGNTGSPQGIALDPAGNLYVANEAQPATIYKFTPGGTRSTVGTTTFPYGIAVAPDGRVFVSDPDDGKIYVFPGKTPFATNLEPYGMTFDTNGNLYVGDLISRSIIKYFTNGTHVTYATTNFSQPSGMAFDRHGNLYVTDLYDSTVFKITPDGTVAPFALYFGEPQGLVIDSAGNMFVADTVGNAVYEFTNTAAGPSTNKIVFATLVGPTGLAALAPAKALLSVDRTGPNSALLSWPGGWTLQLNSSLNQNTWSNYGGLLTTNGQTLGATLPALQNTGFFRLTHP